MQFTNILNSCSTTQPNNSSNKTNCNMKVEKSPRGPFSIFIVWQLSSCFFPSLLDTKLSIVGRWLKFSAPANSLQDQRDRFYSKPQFLSVNFVRMFNLQTEIGPNFLKSSTSQSSTFEQLHHWFGECMFIHPHISDAYMHIQKKKLY